MSMRKLPNVKAVQFDAKTSYRAHREFLAWYRKNQNISILALTNEGPELDEPKLPFAVRVFYEELV